MTSRKPLKRSSAVWLTLSTLAFAQLLCSQPSTDDKQRALQTLKRLVTDQNFRDLGFDARSDAASALLDVPLRRYFITDGALGAFKDNVNPVSLLREGGEWLFPVRAVNKVRCFITMANRGSGWRAVSFGQAEIAQALTAARARQSDTNKMQINVFFAVDILALSSYVLGWRSDGTLPGDKSNGNLFLLSAAIKDKKRLGPSGAQPAAKLLKVFRDEARKHRQGSGKGPN